MNPDTVQSGGTATVYNIRLEPPPRRPREVPPAVRERLGAADQRRVEALARDYEAVAQALSNAVDPLMRSRLERQLEDLQGQIDALARRGEGGD